MDSSSTDGSRLYPLQREDLAPTLWAGGLSMAVYAYTAAPTVTFKDSGELIVAALHWGVPHPTGYPLWTLLAGLFSLLPLGPGAWEVNLFSGVCAAAAVALTAALMHRMARALEVGRLIAGLVAVAVGLIMAFTVTVWSQAVFAEVYTLHVLMAALFWWALYRWYLRPEKVGDFILCVGVLALGMTNHHLMLALSPLPLLVTWIRRRDLFWELLGYCIVVGALFYLAFASISDSELTWETAVRTGQGTLILLVAMVLWRRRLQHWRVGLALIPTVALGLLPYAYMPLASSTNPPMNWGYTRTADGFYYSVNRSPYRGPLADQLMGTLGRLVGTAEIEEKFVPQPLKPGADTSASRLLAVFSVRYLVETSRSFTLLSWPVMVAGLWLLRRRKELTGWLGVVTIGGVLSVLFQPASAALAGAAARLDWYLQMPYLGYTCIPPAILGAYGVHAVHQAVRERSVVLSRLLLVAVVLTPLVGLQSNWAECSQRGRWFAWEYGHDMLAELPPDAVVFGGTDAGRFIPTYMIFGESFEAERHKKDPEFDRRDLYLITQTQLLARFYRSYIRDHYGESRPEPGPVGRLLGRGEAYPEKPLQLPTENDVAVMIQELSARGQTIDLLASEVARWIYLANKDSHTFFVEEGVQMPWTAPLAIPAGPFYRLADAPLEALTAEQIEADRSYWHRRTRTLLADPLFEDDLDARMAFVSLRHQGARIYRDRGLLWDAEQALLQSRELLPREVSTAALLGDLYVRQGRYEEARRAIAPLRAASTTLAGVDRLWAGEQLKQRLRNAAHTQLLLSPGDPAVSAATLGVHADSEADAGRIMGLTEDLRQLDYDPSNVIPLRRVLGTWRNFDLHSLTDYYVLQHLNGSRPGNFSHRRLLQLAVADQQLQPTRLHDSGIEVRRCLARELLRVGEAESAERMLRGLPETESHLQLLDEIHTLRSTQDTLAPVLENWRQGQGLDLPQGSEGAIVQRLALLHQAVQSFRARPEAGRLVPLINAYRALKLPHEARQALLSLAGDDSSSQNRDLLIAAARAAVLDVHPTALLPVAEALERLLATRPDDSRLRGAAMALRFTANDQEALLKHLGEVLTRQGRSGLFQVLGTEPVLAPLMRDHRFQSFLARPAAAQGVGPGAAAPVTSAAPATPATPGAPGAPGAPLPGDTP